MKKLKTIMLICLSLLFLGMVFIAVSLEIYVPGTAQGKNALVVMLLFLSAIPLLLAALFRTVFAAYARQTEQFATRDR